MFDNAASIPPEPIHDSSYTTRFIVEPSLGINV